MSEGPEVTGDNQAPASGEGGNAADLAAELKVWQDRARRMEGLAKDHEKKLEDFKGIDPKEVKALKAEYEEIRKQGAVGNKEEIERLLAETKEAERKQHEGLLSEKDQQIQKLSSTLKELRVVDKVMGKMSDTFTSDSLELIRPLVKQFGELNEEGNIVFKDSEGNVRRSPNNTTQNLGIDEFVAEMAEKYPSAVKSNFKGGTRQPGEQTGSSGDSGISADRYMKMSKEERSQLSPTERGKLAQEALKAGLVR